MYRQTTLFRGPCRSFPFSHFSSHFLFSFGHFLSLFGATTHSVKRRKFPPHFLKSHVWPSIFHLYSLFLYFLFMTSSTTWLHVSHGIHFQHMLIVSLSFLCQVSLFYGAMWHPPTFPCVIRHPHASKNVKSRPPWNPTKFDVVAKFRKRISTKNSVSSSEI